jgi:hypothetical protein
MHHRPASHAAQNGQIRIARVLRRTEPTSAHSGGYARGSRQLSVISFEIAGQLRRHREIREAVSGCQVLVRRTSL